MTGPRYEIPNTNAADPLTMAERIRRAALGYTDPSTGQPIAGYLPHGPRQNEVPRDNNYYLDQVGDASIDRTPHRPFLGTPLGAAILGGIRGGAASLAPHDYGFFQGALRGFQGQQDYQAAIGDEHRSQRQQDVSQAILNAIRLKELEPHPTYDPATDTETLRRQYWDQHGIGPSSAGSQPYAPLPTAQGIYGFDRRTGRAAPIEAGGQTLQPPPHTGGGASSWRTLPTPQGEVRVNPRTGQVSPLRVGGQPLVTGKAPLPFATRVRNRATFLQHADRSNGGRSYQDLLNQAVEDVKAEDAAGQPPPATPAPQMNQIPLHRGGAVGSGMSMGPPPAPAASTQPPETAGDAVLPTGGETSDPAAYVKRLRAANVPPQTIRELLRQHF